MPQNLPLDLFFDTTNLFHGSRMPSNCFDLLSNKLGLWLNDLLSSTYHNHNQPYVEKGCSPLVLGNVHPQAILEGAVYVAEGATVEPTAYVTGPCYIGKGATVRHGAYIRGNVYVGPGSVVGHATEVKSSCFLDGSKAAHFAYVGDSILGCGVNLGAGTRLANFKFSGDEIQFRHPESMEKVGSGLRKFGAIIGDGGQTGCNAVLSPGALLFPKTAIFPCSHYNGTLLRGVHR